VCSTCRVAGRMHWHNGVPGTPEGGPFSSDLGRHRSGPPAASFAAGAARQRCASRGSPVAELCVARRGAGRPNRHNSVPGTPRTAPFPPTRASLGSTERERRLNSQGELPVYDPRMTGAPIVRVQRLVHSEGLDLPSYASTGAAGADLRAAVETDLVLAPGGRAAVPTGLILEIPVGWEGQIRPRSGLAIRHGLTVVNAPGTIDSDYRGELKVLLVNLGSEAVTIHRGDRVAQLVVAPAPQATFDETAALEATERGAGGFGSTGR